MAEKFRNENPSLYDTTRQYLNPDDALKRKAVSRMSFKN